MGKGSYTGGSTIIGRQGRFGSYDPADDGETWLPTKKNQQKGRGRGLTSKKGRKKSHASIGQERANLVRLAAQRIVSSDGLDKPPKKTSPALQVEIEDCGGFFAWAKRQPGFSETLRRLERKKAKKPKKGNGTRLSQQHREPTARGTSLDKEPALVLMRKKLALIDFIAQAEKKIEQARNELTNIEKALTNISE